MGEYPILLPPQIAQIAARNTAPARNRAGVFVCSNKLKDET
jgi:hypothetical protein